MEELVKKSEIELVETYNEIDSIEFKNTKKVLDAFTQVGLEPNVSKSTYTNINRY